MTTKADNAVMERRLRPIYDAIDSNNSKKAIQEADKVLKKHPQTTCAKVLKALALINLDKLCDARNILNALDVPGAVYDEGTLQAFSHCYKEMALPERIVQLFERAVALTPNENNLTQLFMAHVRVRSYKQQQLIAMRMFKEYGNAPYLYWSIMSIVMQAKTDPAMAQKMYYPLADRMTTAHIAKIPFNAGAELELHSIIMEGQGRFLDAEKLLGSELAAKLLNSPKDVIRTKRLQLLSAAGSHRLVFDRALEDLEKNNDDWALWTIFFDSAFEIFKDKDVPEERKKNVMDLLVSTIDREVGKKGVTRGPYIARFELISRLLSAEMAVPSILGEPVNLFMTYILRFYSKPCCYMDIAKYLWLLNDEQKLELNVLMGKFIDNVINKEEKTEKNADPHCWAIIVYERLRRNLGLMEKMTKEERRKHTERVIIHMAHDKRSDLAGAALGQLGAAILWKEWIENDDWQSYWEMLLMLEWTAGKFKPDPLSKLLLCHAYAHVGNVHRMSTLFKALDIKSMQRDTMGHIMFPMFELTGRFNIGLVHYTELADMFDQAEREIAECLIGGYKNGAFAQIPNLVQLGDRMKNSSLAVGGDVLTRFLSSAFVIENMEEVVNTLHGDEDREPIKWDALVDNRDLLVLHNYEPGLDWKTKFDAMQKSTHEEFVDLSRLRHLLLRSVAVVGRLSATEPLKLKETVANLTVHLAYCKQQYQKDSKPSRMMQAPSPVRLSQWVHGGSFEPLVTLLNAAVEVVAVLMAGQKPAEQVLPTAEKFTELLDAAIPSPPDGTKPFGIHEPLFDSSRCLQNLALCHLLVRLLDDLLTSRKEKHNHRTKPMESVACQNLMVALAHAGEKLRQVVLMIISVLQGGSIFPEVGKDWTPYVAALLDSQRLMVEDRFYKTYGGAAEDMITTIENLLLQVK